MADFDDASNKLDGDAAPTKRRWSTPGLILSQIDETEKGVYPVEAGSFPSGVPVYFGPS